MNNLWIEIHLFSEWLQMKRYSEKTIKTYTSILYKAAQYFEEKLDNEEKDIFWYIQKQTQNNISLSYQKQLIGALKLYYNWYKQKKYNFLYIYPSQNESKIPTVLSKKEVKIIINNINNLKHKAIISIIYSWWLRISECIQLQINNIDSQRMQIYIKNSKGAQDRNVPLSKEILKLLRKYYKVYKPKDFLFQWQWWWSYSESSIQRILKRATKSAGILKNVTPHTLRHSYATHLLENWVDIRIIQELLGHKNIKTTQIYTHITNHSLDKIINPFDTLWID